MLCLGSWVAGMTCFRPCCRWMTRRVRCLLIGASVEGILLQKRLVGIFRIERSHNAHGILDHRWGGRRAHRDSDQFHEAVRH